MRSEVSAFLDDELDEAERARIAEGLSNNTELRSAWDEYCLIGDVMRGSAPAGLGFATQVMRLLEAEPTVVAPRRRPGDRRMGPLAAIAASVAAVGVVSWVAFERTPSSTLESVGVRPRPVLAASVATARTAALPTAREEEHRSAPVTDAVIPYLLAHQGYGAAGGMQGVAQYVRVVSDNGQETAR